VIRPKVDKPIIESFMNNIFHCVKVAFFNKIIVAAIDSKALFLITNYFIFSL
jgi:hypothetical protein